jgi:pimeloyl-ACP methyl ester carboxylesterase
MRSTGELTDIGGLTAPAPMFCQIGPIRLAYRYYPTAAASAPTLVCVHGFDRTSRDFIPLARVLSRHWNVVCPDLPGSGDSSWLEAKAAYHPYTYADAMARLIRHLGCDAVDYLGTSVGGVVGMLVASQTTLVQRLVVNDVGPFTPKSLSRALGKAVRARKREFPSAAAAEAYIRQINAPFGRLSDEEWRFCTASCTRISESGAVVSDYDPDVCVPWEAEDVRDRDLWPNWRSLACDILLIRGAQSTVLRADDASQMLKENARASLAEVADVGHAPMFYAADQIELVREWLQRDRSVAENARSEALRSLPLPALA